MKKIIFTLSTIIALTSCGNKTINSKEEAIEFLESHNFYDESATVSGKSGGNIKTGFSLSFTDGKVKIGDELFPYTISGPTENVNSASWAANRIKGYEIKFCGSERYAYGGCIKCYLDCGENREDGAFLKVEGDYVNAYFSYITDESIVEK